MVCSISVAAGASAQQIHISYQQAMARARQLVSRMTLSEKISQLHGIHNATRYRLVPGLPRLGIPSLNITNEPPLQLKGFSKVMLNPGESKTIHMQLGPRAFSFWSMTAHGWKIAPGTFYVKVGDSSDHTPLRTNLAVR